MFAKYLNKLLSSGKSFLAIVGGYTTLRYAYDSSYDTFYHKYKKYNIELEIQKVNLTEEDKKIIQDLAGNELTEHEMKRLKYDFLKRRKQQEIEKFTLEKTNETFEKLYGYKMKEKKD